MIVDTRKRSLELIIKFLIISNNKSPPTKGCESEGMVASGRNQNHPPLPQQPPYVSRFKANLESILTSFVHEYYIRLSNSFPSPHSASACYTSLILWEISNSHYLGLSPCSTAPTRLSTHSTFILKFLAVAFDLNSADVHCDPCNVSGLVGRHVIL